MNSEDNPQRWCSINLVGVPAGLISSAEFNAYPQKLSIAGVQQTHRGLFQLLAGAQDMNQAAEIFRHYMEIVFGLAPPTPEMRGAERRRYRSSYIKLLEGWGFDANSPQGAVLKGWVESRFGLIPTYHKAELKHFPSPAWVGYLEAKLSSRFHNNSIHAQLDLLYEYCQWVVARFEQPGGECMKLWRGINCHGEQMIVEGSLRAGECVVRLNNLVSFTRVRAHAEEFGDWILEAQVPAAKLLFFPGLLPHAPLNGEGEVLALGGLYRVKASYV